MLLQQLVPDVHQQVVAFHLGFNLALALLFIGFTGLVGRTRRPLAARAARPAPARRGRATSTRSR